MVSLSGADLKNKFHLISLYLLYSGAFFYFSVPSVGRPVLELFLITGVFSLLWHFPRIWRSPVFLLLGACILIQIASWAYCDQNFPQYAKSNPDLKRLGHLFLFLPIAWVLKQNNRSPWALMTIFFLGLCMTPFFQGEGWQAFFDGKRSRFGFRNAQHAALIFAIALVALVVFRKRAFDWFDSAKKFALGALSIAILYCIVIVAIANTRGVFLGLLAGALATATGVLLKNARPRMQEALMMVALVIIIGASLGMTAKPLTRWLGEIETVTSVLSGDAANIPRETSSGIRIHTWIEGWKWFGRSPWVGWGENGQKLAIKESSALPESIRLEFGHLHNSYLETLVNNGIIGITLLFALHAWLATTISRGCRRRGVKDVQLFCLVAGVLWLTANFFESFMFYRSGVMMFGIGSASLLIASGYNFGVSSRSGS